jgi:Major Facilitator Superfamily
MRDLRLLAGATAVSAAGDLVLVVVLASRVHDLTGSGFAVAALFAALMGPIALLASPAGKLVDRTETRRVLALVSVAQAVVATGLVFADGLAAILPLTALLGAGAAVAGPAEAALVPVVARDLTKANGRIESARYAGFTAGPLIAGALTAAGGTRVALAVNAASFAAVAIGAALMHARRPPVEHAAAPATREGAFSLLLADPILRVTVTAAVAALLFISASMTIEVFYVRDVVGAGGAGYALVFAAWAVGMVGGALTLAPRVKLALATGAMLALALQGAGMAASACWPVLAWAMAGYFLGGIGHGVKNVLMRTLIQERIARERHGRAFAAYGAARNTAELGALGLGGIMVATLGAQPALLIAGLGPVVAGLLALAYRSSSATALSRRIAPATSSGSPSPSNSATQASGSNIG